MINNDSVIEMQHSEDEALYKELNDLKTKKLSLRTAVTIGMRFVCMANRQKFISPSDRLRGGHDNDPENFVAFPREFREAAGVENLKPGQGRLILSVALPGGPFHGQYFTIPELAKYAIGPDKQGCQEKGAMAYFETKELNNNFQIASAKTRAPDHFDRKIT
ncbi:hypothetical protein BGZ80_001471 [Entomortierella chlamydospora]|uniref:Uncharacterized protein n=1 Tax=Entomortierella chlamydospora TaxID=101097 RepID=A0A9P6MQY8_9FUNG|nr:hypothetical protein BGZ80_001471 [Entomortierella chlamydospora]